MHADIRAGANAAPAYRPLGTFRFVLALLVVAQHFTNIGPEAFNGAVAPLGLGSLAVLVFFAVSGFVIAEAIETFYRGRAGAFLTNRAIRIFPPLLATLALSLAVYALLFRLGPVASPDALGAGMLDASILSLSNIAGNIAAMVPGMKMLGFREDFTFVAVAWSIRTEFLFYFVMAAALLLPGRWYRPALVLIAVAASVGFVVHIAGRGPETLRFVPYFVFGVAAYYALAGQRIALGLLTLASLGCVVEFVTSPVMQIPALIAAYGPIPVDARFALLVGLMAAIPLLAILSAGRFERIDRVLGDLSYPVYLNHCVVLPAVRTLLPDLGMAGLAAVTLYALALSYVMYALIEPGLIGLRNRVRRASTATAAPAFIPATAANDNRGLARKIPA